MYAYRSARTLRMVLSCAWISLIILISMHRCSWWPVRSSVQHECVRNAQIPVNFMRFFFISSHLCFRLFCCFISLCQSMRIQCKTTTILHLISAAGVRYSRIARGTFSMIWLNAHDKIPSSNMNNVMLLVWCLLRSFSPADKFNHFRNQTHSHTHSNIMNVSTHKILTRQKKKQLMQK